MDQWEEYQEKYEHAHMRLDRWPWHEDSWDDLWEIRYTWKVHGDCKQTHRAKKGHRVGRKYKE